MIVKSKNGLGKYNSGRYVLLQIQIVNGVILIAWRQRVLERQIDYGAKLGHVVLSLAKMELNNFYKNVMPVADYFDQRGMVIAVSDIIYYRLNAHKVESHYSVTIVHSHRLHKVNTVSTSGWSTGHLGHEFGYFQSIYGRSINY